MKKYNIGIIGPSEIAFRRFLPALKKSTIFNFSGIAYASQEEWTDSSIQESIFEIETRVETERIKAERFINVFGGRLYSSYSDIILDKTIDAIYVPLPPLLHYKWGKIVLNNKKHLFLEKPFTVSKKETVELNEIAKNNNLATHENFAFIFHKQINVIKENLSQIGDIRLIRASFGFPYRGEKDFRYSKTLGGGALLDCGGYPLKLASYFLGPFASVECSHLHTTRSHEVDLYGSATLTSGNQGLIAQIAFGMDNAYKCELEVWGSEGIIYAPRIFTPTSEMETKVHVTKESTEIINVEPDDQFLNSLEYFGECISDSARRFENYSLLNIQATLMDEIKKGALK